MTSVLSSLHFSMSGLRRRSDAPVSGAQSEPRPHRTVRRNLFGPIDHEFNAKFLQRELAKIGSADSNRWNFDFVNNKPLDGKMEWTKTALEAIPSAYQMPNLTARLNMDHRPSTSTPNPHPDHSDNIELENITKLCTDEAFRPINSIPDDSTPEKQEEQTSKRLTPEVERSLSPVQLTTSVPISIIKPVVTKSTQHIQTNTNKKLRQPKITDFLKSCKRPRSSSECKSDEVSSAPSLKRARSSS